MHVQHRCLVDDDPPDLRIRNVVILVSQNIADVRHLTPRDLRLGRFHFLREATAGPLRPPTDLAPVPEPPPEMTPTPGGPAEVCGECRPPQGVHPLATSFTCAHGHWVFD